MKRIAGSLSVRLRVNHAECTVTVRPQDLLVEVLREAIGLTGTKFGCNSGSCGICTVLLDGRAVKSCLVLALRAVGRSVETIEGLGTAERPHPIQEAFVRCGGVQCGICTPGFILAAKALLDEAQSPTEEEIREYLSGNLCRCTGYVKIIDAVRDAALVLARSRNGPVR